MPELPEVETIRAGLEKNIIDKKIVDIIIDNQKSFQGQESKILDQNIEKIERRAKVLNIHFKNRYNLLFHLKMTGQLIYIDYKTRFARGHPSHDWHDKLPNKHTRITFIFNDDSKLFFNDLRKFGWAKVMTDTEIQNAFHLYGPEPFSKEFTAKYLFTKAKNFPTRTIKQFIMDQTIIAGVGNIYADESLFLSKIMPISKVSKLSLEEFEEIRKNIIKVLKLGIKYGGTTDSDYVDVEGKKGGMQDHLNVYHKTGEKCPNNCGDLVERTVIGGRGTNFCPSCQKEKL